MAQRLIGVVLASLTVAAIAGGGGYLAGHAGGANRSAAVRLGHQRGTQAGTLAGEKQGYQRGRKAGERAGYGPAFRSAYQKAYRLAVKG
jgi:hypothetical protein